MILITLGDRVSGIKLRCKSSLIYINCFTEKFEWCSLLYALVMRRVGLVLYVYVCYCGMRWYYVCMYVIVNIFCGCESIRFHVARICIVSRRYTSFFNCRLLLLLLSFSSSAFILYNYFTIFLKAILP